MGSREKHKSYIEGPQYVVTWALGHLVGLAEPEDYDSKYATWNLEDLPILPKSSKLKVLRESNHQFKAVQQLMKRQDIGELIVATDAAREGELLARWIIQMATGKSPSGAYGSPRRRTRRLRQVSQSYCLVSSLIVYMNRLAVELRQTG